MFFIAVEAAYVTQNKEVEIQANSAGETATSIIARKRRFPGMRLFKQ